MLELLPNAQKKSLKKEYFLRFSVVALLFLSALGIIFLVALSPSYFLSVVKERVVAEEFDNSMKSKRASEGENLQAAIKDSKEMLSLLKREGDDRSLIKSVILKIIDNKNPGIKINGISINYSKKDQYQVVVTGTSKNREFLKTFADSLKAEKDFSDIDLPISNFAKISDIDFSISLKTVI